VSLVGWGNTNVVQHCVGLWVALHLFCFFEALAFGLICQLVKNSRLCPTGWRIRYGLAKWGNWCSVSPANQS